MATARSRAVDQPPTTDFHGPREFNRRARQVWIDLIDPDALARRANQPLTKGTPMPVVYALNGTIGSTVNISSFIRSAQANPAGPMPGLLAQGIATVNLTTGQTGMQFIHSARSKTVVIGLI